MKEAIRKFDGTIIGWVETDSSGNQIVRDFIGTILGKYDKQCDVTRKFDGTVIARGNSAISLLYTK